MHNTLNHDEFLEFIENCDFPIGLTEKNIIQLILTVDIF